MWYELKVLPLVWKAKMHWVQFWLEALNAEKYNGRLLIKEVSEASSGV